ncbi:MAG: hypothetical protein RLZZ512_9 [Bacteroidota bacterium]
MGSTVTISKAKNFSFKKLSFLYLVFILFIFFSSPGMYVTQYTSVANTQASLNDRLLQDLKAFNSLDPKELDLKNTTLDLVKQLDDLNNEYKKFAVETSVSGDRLRENNFAEKRIRKGAIGPKVVSIIDQYVAKYNTVGKKDLTNDLITPADFSGTKINNLDFFFKEAPNGVMSTAFEHLRTVFLYQSLIVLKGKDLELPKFEILTVEESDFIQRFKRNLILGEKLDVLVRPKKKGALPTVKINGGVVDCKPTNGSDFRVIYQPSKAGNYSMEIMVGEDRVLTSFRVEAPAFRYIQEVSNLRSEVGGKFTITLDTNFVPKGDRVRFVSNAADVQRVGMILYVTPQKEGKFEVLMQDNGSNIDKATFFASMPRSPKVSLMDVSGNPVNMQSANKLESENTFWQVIDFDMAVVSPDGKTQRLHSATRFLRNELREAESKAPKGSTLIFDNIRLAGQNGGATTKGSPIIMVK